MKKERTNAKAVVGTPKKSQNGSTQPKNEKSKSPPPLGRVVRKEGVEKPKYNPRGKVVR